MASYRTLLTIALAVVAAVILASLWQGRKTSLAEKNKDVSEKKNWIQPLEEKRLIESLEGPELFQAYCAACHGKDGKGGGPVAPALKATVPDLTRISQRSGGKFPADRVQKIISGDDLGMPAHGSREMPIWGPVFGRISWDLDLGRLCIYNLSKYLESIQEK